eukprot:gb/GFBE01018630.1/.p1 GENE.gb/GFBE01018630.1/~~gb/GFBE01018630.1/.p1  ORF type:complete len:280 (+),score=65.84 gb/GFBE01018630.1/:1-840(+)
MAQWQQQQQYQPGMYPNQHQHHEHHDDSSGSDEGGCLATEGQPHEYSGKQGIAGAPDYVRRDFVRKVYSILTIQLLLTTIIAAPFNSFLDEAWVRSHMSLYYFALFGSLAIVVGMACCCQQAARTYPTNYLLLFTFTALEGICVGFVTSFYSTQSVLLALAVTVVTFFCLTVYACFTKTDFTGMGPYLSAALFALIGFSFVVSMMSIFVGIPNWLHVLYALAGVIIFSFYIIYDTQMIIGGSHNSHQFSIDDYVFAALNLYLDIINLFLYLLSLLGDRN